jgi:hypothetical protein
MSGDKFAWTPKVMTFDGVLLLLAVAQTLTLPTS